MTTHKGDSRTAPQGHTPGPWVVEQGSVYTKRPNENGQFPRIALMDREEDETRPTERDANARLIAAAPELLAALKRIASHPHGGVLVNIARDAIAKAETGKGE